MNELEAVLKRTPKGIFSEKIWSLDRRVYHPKYLIEDEVEEEAIPFNEKSVQEAYEGLL